MIDTEEDAMTLPDERDVRLNALRDAQGKLCDVQTILRRANHPPNDWFELEALVRLCTREATRLLDAYGRVLKVPDAE